MDTKKLQTEYDALTKEISELTKKKKAITKTFQDAGYALVKKKFEVDKPVIGIFHDLDYYSHFDGHTSDAIYYYVSGAEEFSDKNFNRLKEIITEFPKKGDENKDLIEELIEDIFIDYYDFAEYFLEIEDTLSFFKIIDENTIKWTYKGDGDQGELVDNSFVEIRLTTKSEIKSIKTINTM